jgi:DNA-directed RNA polymerase specialized sigma24 family protein
MDFLLVALALGCTLAIEALYRAYAHADDRAVARAQQELLAGAMEIADRHLRRYRLSDDRWHDLCQDCRIALWRAFCCRKAKSAPMPEERLVAYVRRIAGRCAAQYFRIERPEWTRLKNRLRHLARKADWLETSAGEGSTMASVCRLADSGASSASALPALPGDAPRRFHADYFEHHRHSPDELPFPRLVRALLAWIGRPVYMDALVNCLMELLSVPEGAVPLDEDYMLPAEGAVR